MNAEVVVTGSDPHTWEPNVEEIEQVLQTRPVRAIVLTNPGNPSGAVLGVLAIQVSPFMCTPSHEDNIGLK